MRTRITRIDIEFLRRAPASLRRIKTSILFSDYDWALAVTNFRRLRARSSADRRLNPPSTNFWLKAWKDAYLTLTNRPLRRPAQLAAGRQRAGHTIDMRETQITGIVIARSVEFPEVIEAQLAVNLFGSLNVTRAFLPLLKRSKGAIVNNISTVALAALPIMPGYSISKAAALSMTQSLRALLPSQGVTVHATLTGPVDTDMTRGIDHPKASPESAAAAIFDGVEQGAEEIFPDPLSQSIAEGWRNGAAKALERKSAVFVPENTAL
jgi:hypothetical protein